MAEDPEPKTLFSFLTASNKLPEERQQATEHLATFMEDEDPVGHHVKRVTWAKALWILAAICVFYAGYRTNVERVLAKSMKGMGLHGPDESIEAIDTSNLSDEERWMLGGGVSGTESSAEKLHQSEPENPLYFRMRVDEYYWQGRLDWGAESSLPADTLQTARRIDPDNAYFLLLQAGATIGDSIEKERLVEISDEDRKARRYSPSSYEPTNPEAFEEAVKLVEEATKLPRFQGYLRRQMMEIASIYDRAGRNESYAGFMMSLIPWMGISTTHISIKKSEGIISAAGYQAMLKQDKERLLEVIAMREAFMRMLGESEDQSLIAALVYQANAQGSATDLGHYCEQLGMESEASRLKGQAEALVQHRLRAKEAHDNDIEDEMLARMSVIHGVALPVVQSRVVEPPPFSDDTIKPLRMAEHDFATGLTLRGSTLLLFGIAGILFGAVQRMTHGMHQCAGRAARCLRFQDWLWVMLLGVLAPFLLHALLMRFTPLGGRDYGVRHSVLVYPVVPTLCLHVSVLLLSAALLRWRLIRRLPLREPCAIVAPRTGILLSITLLVPVLAYVLFQKSYVQEVSMAPSIVLFAVWLLPLIVLLVASASALRRAYGRNARERFLTAASAQCLLYGLPVVIFSCLLTARGWHLSESRWLAQDKTLRLDASDPDLGLYENRVAHQLYKEINAIVLPRTDP